MVKGIRQLVSKRKRRYKQDGFDLDLSYVADRIVAMGYPSLGVEAIYRNPMDEVQRFFNTKHPHRYRIYNLCSERAYDLTGKFDKVERFPFDDHNPCALEVVQEFCASVESYLAEHDDNVVGIHCKAGKGRTGLLVSCLLLHGGLARNAGDALALFAQKRTLNGKGVTIPSQARYCFYYERILRQPEVIVATYQVTHMRMVGVPNFDSRLSGGGCDPYVVLKTLERGADGDDNAYACRERTIFNLCKAAKKAGNALQHFYPQDRLVDIDLTPYNVRVRGDTKLMFMDEDYLNKDDKMFSVWFHTAFIDRNYLVFHKDVCDKACKDKQNKHFPKGFQLQVFLHRVDDGGLDFDDDDDDDDADHANADANDGDDDDP
uniref:Phosphatidylinositol 3,4,5-trisphosphate 3-phosphatase and dual-specificity protein phosphatase PTEN n=1 Tax=Phaeomonas parva TaxID=124430 RepID=A0A7S1TU70_9STRA|mmetsp:Transcript_17185/g.52771  ORF Transcript_17185/g.52771 Transcript_17185/m.52771 type:complete len:375 (+) Transcript_17185:127-1251(+)